MHICVPRNMTQAAGMYNTLLKGDDPALVIEVLNGYRLKEPMPSNLDTMCVPLGVPEVIRQGSDVTLVTYGANCKLALEAADILQGLGIELEIIDVQTLLPFDRPHLICESLQRTNRLLVLDEDVPGGASAYILQQVMEVQGGYRYLDEAPRTLTAQAHRPAYGSDGDYFSKPNTEQIIDLVTQMMHGAQPTRYPRVYL
jgi:pyruvate/2-oxoglutarate/acetoin dehydrogenase E1 component